MQNFLTTIGFGDFRAETMEQKIFFIVICVPGHTLTTAMLTQLADQAMGLLHSGRRVGRNSKRRMKVPSFVLSLSLSLSSLDLSLLFSKRPPFPIPLPFWLSLSVSYLPLTGASHSLTFSLSLPPTSHFPGRRVRSSPETCCQGTALLGRFWSPPCVLRNSHTNRTRAV